MQIIVAFFIFCIVLFIYLHIQFHLKTSNDLEIFEIDQASKDKLEEIADLRQPIVFDLEDDRIIQTTNKAYILNNYKAFEINIRNVKETDYNSEIYMPLPIYAAAKLFNEDKTGTYFSEHNADFLQETGLVKKLQYNDEFLRPYMLSNFNYDIIMGSENTCTPFHYELNYRNYILATQGTIHIKLAPPHSSKYLYPVYDYENFEFRSPLNPWSIQPQYSADFDKMKCLDVTLTPGRIIYIPAYWWYSVKFGKDSSASCFRYRTYMNNIVISPQIAMYAIQIQNIVRNVTKKHDIRELNKVNKYSKSDLGEKEEEDENGGSDGAGTGAGTGSGAGSGTNIVNNDNLEESVQLHHPQQKEEKNEEAVIDNTTLISDL